MNNERLKELLRNAIINYCRSKDAEYSCSLDNNCISCLKTTFNLIDEEIKELHINNNFYN